MTLPLPALVAIAVGVGLAGSVASLLRLNTAWVGRFARYAGVVDLLLLVLLAPLLAGAAVYFTQPVTASRAAGAGTPAPAPAEISKDPIDASKMFRELTPSPAATDFGNPVRLLVRYGPDPQPWNADDEARKIAANGLTRSALLIAPAPAACNCHGWIFTSGRYAVANDQVSAILQDNGYRAVAVPAIGDLAIYGDESGRIIHSGLVVGIASNDTVLVESKWGYGGSRFVHPADAIPYAPCLCTFFHSPRRGHLLHGLPLLSPEHSSPLGT